MATVLPHLDALETQLAKDAANHSLKPAIRAAAALGRKTIMRYFDKIESSAISRICVVLHPSLKLGYFQQMEWPTEDIDDAKEAIRLRLRRHYNLDSVPPIAVSSEPVQSPASNLPHKDANDVNPFAAPPVLRISNPTAAAPTVAPVSQLEAAYALLDKFLSDAPEPAITDPVGWWYQKRAEYGILARLAMDYLTIAPTSIGPERVFSRGRIVVTHLRNRLSAEMTRAILCLGEWSRCGLIDLRKLREVVAHFPRNMTEEEIAAYDFSDGWDAVRPP